jgi:hypothetical protein
MMSAGASRSMAINIATIANGQGSVPVKGRTL